MPDTGIESIVIDGVTVQPADGDPSWTQPSKQWEQLTDEAREEGERVLNEFGFDEKIVQNLDIIEAVYNTVPEAVRLVDLYSPEHPESIIRELEMVPNGIYYGTLFFPRLAQILEKRKSWLSAVLANDEAEGSDSRAVSDPGMTLEDLVKVFGKNSDVFEPVTDFLTTQQRITNWIANNTRPNTEPAPVAPYQLRLGLSRFVVPPINIAVHQSFKAGSLTGSALRQQGSPKFNTGHSDTVISMTIYFPNHESIWGFDGGFSATDEINFDLGGDTDEKIDGFLSSLRGLIAQFKYSPLLPVRNAYLNGTHNVSAVALQSMSVQTIPDYPFCLAVTLNLLSFNHKVFLPMISDFNQAMHWGRFRQYVGWGLQKLNGYTSQGFLTEEKDAGDGNNTSIIEYESDVSSKFSKSRDLGGVENGNKLEIYYPTSTPVKVFGPDTYTWRQFGEDDIAGMIPGSTLWDEFLRRLGFDPQDDPNLLYDYLSHFVQNTSESLPSSITDQKLLIAYLIKLGQTVDQMSDEAMDAFINAEIDKRRAEFGDGYSPEQEAADREQLKMAWYTYMFNNFSTSPLMKKYVEDEKRKRDMKINEWEVPMTKLLLDWNKVIIDNIAVNMANSFARLQVQMQGEPTFQHIGGKDSTVSVSMKVFGENELIKIRRVFEHINGLARLEHSHGVLGFFGLKNVITTLCGIKYAVPLNFEVDTIPNYPHVYDVKLDFVDFDVFQQKRETISSEQQKELMTVFSKRNPFLRTKQLWSAFNGYPDLPLSIYEQEHIPTTITVDSFNPFGNSTEITVGSNSSDNPVHRRLIGHLDPDFIYRQFQTIEDQLIDHHLETRPSFGTAVIDEVGDFDGVTEALLAVGAYLEDSNITGAALGDVLGTILDDSTTGASLGDAVGTLIEDSDITGAALGDALGTLIEDSDITGAALADALGSLNPPAQTSAQTPALTGLNEIYVSDLLEIKTWMGGNGGIKCKKGDIAFCNIDQNGKFKPAINNAIDVVIGGEAGEVGGDNGYAAPKEDHAGQNLSVPHVPGLQPFGGSGGYGSPVLLKEGSTTNENDPAYQYQQMMADSQYRSKSGRMVRAFPTYMLWLIDEGGYFAGVKLFNNFYGVQSVIDFSINSSEDVLGDTLILNLSNLHSKLDSQYSRITKVNSDGTTTIIHDEELQDILQDPENISDRIDNMILTRLGVGLDNIKSGTEDTYLREFNGIRLKPGVRVHLRMGYSADPNKLDTVFNGTITQVTSGEIVEVVAQSDAIELSPYINTTEQGGHSGSIDGALNTGLYLSEPRDLMVRLLSMGSSNFREAIAHATQGMIFSQNKFGIRHFGQILYEPMSSSEAGQINVLQDAVHGHMSSYTNLQTGDAGPLTSAINLAGFGSGGIGQRGGGGEITALMTSLYENSFRHRDYELFKRNIYPGNGSGVAQYLGGDFPEAGLMIAEAAGSDGDAKDFILGSPVSEQSRTYEASKRGMVDPGTSDSQQDEQNKENQDTTQTDAEIEAARDERDAADRKKRYLAAAPAKTTLNDIPLVGTFFTFLFNGGLDDNPFFKALGIVQQNADDDLAGFDEVSFRAQTYMKSVWDLFRLCAALLPNYVVSVRPFEDRSTVFYGKPHWLYTSGVVPLTAGVPRDNTLIKPIEPDAEQNRILREISNRANPLSDFEERQSILKSLNTSIVPDPAGSTAGIGFTGDDVKQLDSELVLSNGNKIALPTKQGKIVGEMHLPTAAEIKDEHHQQSDSLPDSRKWPWYMDRAGDKKGGVDPTATDPSKDSSILFEDADVGGEQGSFGFFDKPGFGGEEEKWYICMRWPYSDRDEKINGQPVYRPDTKKEDYPGKRVAVQSEKDSSKIIIAAIGDYGPHEDTGRMAGLSPECMEALGVVNDDKCYFGFVDQDIRLGPTTSSSLASGDNAAVAETTGKKVNDIAGTVESFNKVSGDYERGWNDPSVRIWANQKDYKITDPKGFAEIAALDPVGHYARLMYDRRYSVTVSKWVAEGSLDASVINNLPGGTDFTNVFGDVGQLEWYSVGGDRVDQFDDSKLPPPGVVAMVAEEIWDEFRRDWIINSEDSNGIRAFLRKHNWGKKDDAVWLQKRAQAGKDDIHPDTLKPSDEGYWDEFGSENPLPDHNNIYEDIRPADDLLRDVPGDDDFDYIVTELVGNFKKFMWQVPYARAWLVITCNFQTALFANTMGEDLFKYAAMVSTPGIVVEVANLIPGIDVDNPLTREALVDWGDAADPGRVLLAFDAFLDITYAHAWPDGADSERGDWRDIAAPLGDGPNEIQAEMLKWLEDHAHFGTKSVNPLENQLEDLSIMYDNTIGRLLSVAANTLQGLVSMFRLQLQQMGMGLDQVGKMQRNANMLNKVFDDSIYYNEGSSPNGRPNLLRLADNPFTREYGEPVIEIREPFQRLHYIDSFQHILNNGIQENLDGVSTVVTASSDGKYPVSVYYDKGLSTNLQMEKTVETGLFWDNASGEGFFSFLHPLLHPIETLRGYAKLAQGSSDELLSKRVALWHLKESLKDIYGGEILVLGDAEIRPHDLVYIADVYERIYGMFEVEAVTHHFTPETGFITSITPNAVVTVNDPTRWSFVNWITGLFGTKNIRDDTRNYLNIFADDTSPIATTTAVTTADLAEALKVPLLGGTIFTGGHSALVKDMVAAKASGLLLTQGEQARFDKLAALLSEGLKKEEGFAGADNAGLAAGIGAFGMAFSTLSAPAKAAGSILINNQAFGTDAAVDISRAQLETMPGVGAFIGMAWDLWDDVKENLFDQHACYIQFLTKDGQAMDSSLSYAQGTAVGRFHTVEILPEILGISTKTPSADGHYRITTNELLEALGWHEIDIANQHRDLNWWVNQTNTKILEAAGKGPDGAVTSIDEQYIVSLVRVTKIEDGDTFDCSIVDGDLAASASTNTEDITVRLFGVRVFELSNHENPELVPDVDPGRRATEYLESIMPVGTLVVLRQLKGEETGRWGRQLATVFHRPLPQDIPESSARIALLMGYAGRTSSGGVWVPSQSTAQSWDGYSSTGEPYTVNWEMIMAGYGDVDMYAVGKTDEDIGGAHR